MEAPSFVSKARTAFHSAAAKAERVLADIKSDFKHDRDVDGKSPASLSIEDESPSESAESKAYHESKNLRWRPPPITLGSKQDWQDRLRNIRRGRKGADDTEKSENSKMSFPIFDENLYMVNEKNDAESRGSESTATLDSLIAGNTEKIPPAPVIKQLAVAVENGRKFSSMKDFLATNKGSSPIRERAGLSLSAVRSLVLREKEDNISEFPDEVKLYSLISLLFDAEGNLLRRKISSSSDTTAATLPRDIHAAPPESFVAKVSEIIGSCKTMRDMALFWCRVVAELRRSWYEEQHIAGIPADQIPDLNCCLLYQQLQVINCCISRKRRHRVTSASLDTTIREASSQTEKSNVPANTVSDSPALYARLNTGELVLRLGADHPCDDLCMLETGELVYSPVTQEGPLLTEDLIKETEEFILRTGSVGAGCSQLLSDMQAFKAANPGCILEDFVRWHSPPDWTESDLEYEDENASTKGQLSSRMQKEGNLWRELWEAAKPVPAVKQAPLYDEDLAVEGILDFFEDIPPIELFEQLFVTLLAEGFMIAEASISADPNFSKLFYECKDYVTSTCQGSIREKVDDLWQVYETVEMMLLKPEEALKMMQPPEDTSTTPGEPRRRFKRLSLIFGGKDKQIKEQEMKNQKIAEDNLSRQSFASFFDSKSSLFSRKPPRPGSASPAEKPSCPDENDWTIV
ncbi:rab3 GTPase-activating protein catalytic subunit isoform X1 [Rhodamnia argentea]|uniref:Rab3 GTPase-activating protein catalytic subunit isoform X1 n=1 Tax=Rhodamnia argentea TaxID=178133 RepID=A0A8B8Q8I5_9MYRT|nr:rab3 GTPase-activating protein catalytic subunit isoform X1 [Rhodamnia argentea]